MSFYDFVEKLQSQPDHKKRKMVFFATAVAAVLVVGFWVLNLKGQLAGKSSSFSFGQQEESTVQEKTKEEGGSIVSPFKSLGNGLALFIADIQNQSENFLSKTSDIYLEDSLVPQKDRPVYKLPTLR